MLSSAARDNVEGLNKRGKELNTAVDRSGELLSDANIYNQTIAQKLKEMGMPATIKVDHSKTVFLVEQRQQIRAKLQAYYQELEQQKLTNPIKPGKKGTKAQNDLVVLYVDIGNLIKKIDQDKPFVDFWNQWECLTKKRCVVKAMMGISTKLHPVVTEVDNLLKAMIDNQVKRPYSNIRSQLSTVITPSSSSPSVSPSSTGVISKSMSSASVKISTDTDAQKAFLLEAKNKLDSYWRHLEKKQRASALSWFYEAEPVADKIEAVKKLHRQEDYASFKANWQSASAELIKHRPFTICGIRFSFTSYLFNPTGKNLIDGLQKTMADVERTQQSQLTI
ncbi:MAG: hypothetical protein V4501_00905 [Pseudomonadota bacterium]